VITGGALVWIRTLDTALILLGAALVLFRPQIEIPSPERLRSMPDFAASALGLLGAAGALFAVELGFHAYNTISARYRPPEVVRFSAPLWRTDAVSDLRKTVGNRVVYDVTYRRDAIGARVTPDSAPASAKHSVVFFGGSFTFGQGVQDTETLPNQFARLAPSWHVANFGYPGHGPAHMLERLQRPGGARGLTNGRTIVVDVFIPDHVRRTIGSMRIATTWGRDFPLYVVNEDGRLERRGTMQTGQPLLALTYNVLAREPIMKCFNVDLPFSLIEKDLDLVARIDAEAKALVHRVNPRAEFVVVLFPDHPRAEFPAARLVPHLQAVGVHVLDYSTQLQGEEMWIPGDGLPAPEAYARVARLIAGDLGLSAMEYRANSNPGLTD